LGKSLQDLTATDTCGAGIPPSKRSAKLRKENAGHMWRSRQQDILRCTDVQLVTISRPSAKNFNEPVWETSSSCCRGSADAKTMTLKGFIGEAGVMGCVPKKVYYRRPSKVLARLK